MSSGSGFGTDEGSLNDVARAGTRRTGLEFDPPSSVGCAGGGAPRTRVHAWGGDLREYRDRGGRVGAVGRVGDWAGRGVAALNGLSSAQLAASHPVSGGTYEYGYRYLNPTLGFTAGWMFLCAKSASAATAALGCVGYLWGTGLLSAAGEMGAPVQVAGGIIVVVVLTAVVAGGIQRSSRANTMIVGLTIASLVVLIAVGSRSVWGQGSANWGGFVELGRMDGGWSGLWHATALMFVAYTGYGRIATLGEEVRDPQRTIPRAIIVTLALTAMLYAAVALVAVATLGSDQLARSTEETSAPLEAIARQLGSGFGVGIVAIGAITALLGVLLNLILGLSRVVLAMARRGDLPARFATVDTAGSSPRAAVILVGVVVAGLVTIGSVKVTWSFSAFTVLVYYALTNLAALQLPPESRLYSRWIPAMGLCCCLGLAFWVEPMVWGVGLGLIAVGVVWHRLCRARRDPSSISRG